MANSKIRIGIGLIPLLLFLTQVQAEYRVALLIGNSKYQEKDFITEEKDLQELSGALAKFGFQSQIVENLDEKELKSRIESFANQTPPDSVALIYFAGQVSNGSEKDQPRTFLMGTNSRKNRGYAIESAFDQLSLRGGSRINLILTDSPKSSEYKSELLENSFLASTNDKDLIQQFDNSRELLAAIKASSNVVKTTLASNLTVAEQGSQSISSPDQFVEGKKAGDEWVNNRGMVFCWCPPGKYTAGSPMNTVGRYPDETERLVEIKDGFWFSKYEITFGQWGSDIRHAAGREKSQPVNMVNQSKDTVARKLKPLNETEWKKGSLPKSWHYHLPTEEQWEYAARAGSTGTWYFGEDVKQLPQHANFGDKSFYNTKDIYSNSAHRILEDGFTKLAPVGSLKPNAWGIHDVYGNVAEWCSNNAVRGGSWLSVAENCRSAYRLQRSDRDNENYIGVRYIIQKIPPQKPKDPAQKK